MYKRSPMIMGSPKRLLKLAGGGLGIPDTCWQQGFW
jgi:hypothetical protein